jgi:hypothetical protein
VVAADAFMDLLQVVLAFFRGNHFMSTPEVAPRL